MSIIKSSQSPPEPSDAGGISGHQTSDDEHLSKRDLQAILGAGAGGLSALFLIAWLLLPFSSKILPFVVVSAWPLLTLIVVAYQAVVYRRQWNAMQSQREIMDEQLEIERAKTYPRLRVSKIRIENFEAGQNPIFITTIANDGFIDATGVEIHIGIRLGDDRAFKWIDPQTVMIPARGEESYPIVTGASLSEQDMEDFNTKKVSIEVVVGIRFWNGSPTEPRDFCYRYCYQYLPWPTERRPDDVQQFFPCDFKHGINIGLRIQGAQMTLSTGTVTASIQPAAPEEPKPEEGTKPEDEDNEDKPN